MLEHDDQVGQLLKLIDDLGVADNTIVIYSTDNGPHFNRWPDGGITPFRSEKNTNWEGGYRVPCIIRWPGHIEPNSVSNEITSHQDWVPTLMAAVKVDGIKEKLKSGYQAGQKRFKAHLDGYDLLPYLSGKEKEWPRRDFAYFNDDGLLANMRVEDWKFVLYEQRATRFDL